MSAVCCSGVPGVVTVGAFVEATLLGGLGIDGKKASLDPLGKTVPLVGKVGDPGRRRKVEIIDKLHVRAAPYGGLHLGSMGLDYNALHESGAASDVESPRRFAIFAQHFFRSFLPENSLN